MSLTALTGATGAGLITAGNILNGQNSNSNSDGESWENSQSSSSSSSSSESRVLGNEASAKDIERAAEANALNDAYLLAQMQYNSGEAEKARKWSENMSNTAYQRQVKDLIAAGLNPMLALGASGASTPNVVQASSGLQSAVKANTYAEEYSSSRSNSSSHSSSTGGSKTTSNSKTTTQLNTLLGAIGSAAKGVMEGATSQVQKNIDKGADYSWGSSKY